MLFNYNCAVATTIIFTFHTLEQHTRVVRVGNKLN